MKLKSIRCSATAAEPPLMSAEEKRVFHGANVTGICKPELDWEKGDDIPW